MAWVDFFLFVSSPKKGRSRHRAILDVRQIQESTPDAVAKENHVRKTLGTRNFGGGTKERWAYQKKSKHNTPRKFNNVPSNTRSKTPIYFAENQMINSK